MVVSQSSAKDSNANREATPLVSVVMSLYNSERYLTEAIDSVLIQTLTNFEFIIINDGSKDGSADIVRSYDDPRIRFVSQKNAGLPAALNRAIQLARSDLIARMDPDDICLPERLDKQYEFLRQHDEAVIVGSAAACIDESGRALVDLKMPLFHPMGETLAPESPCVHPSVMFRRSIFLQVGGYPEKMRFGGEDAVLFNRMLAFGTVTNLSEKLIQYRLSHSSMSHKSRQFDKLLRKLVYKEIFSHPISSRERLELAVEYKCSGDGWFGYYLYLGKLFLASANKGKEAKSYFIKALQENPLSAYAWGCLASSYMPLCWRRTLLKVAMRVKIRTIPYS